MNKAFILLLIGAGGFLGSIARYALSVALMPVIAGFPLGTLTVNIAGSFLIGLLSELTVSAKPISPDLKLLLITGFCGGFTTFSSYLFDSSLLLKEGNLFLSLLYLSGNLVGGFMALYAGITFARLFSS